jgi:hypothetical protein
MMTKITLVLVISISGLYSADNVPLSMRKMRDLYELCHCGCLHKVIAFTTTLNCLREGAFILGKNEKISYGIIAYQKQTNSKTFPRYQIIMRTFRKMEADGFECSLGHPYDDRLPCWTDGFDQLLQNSNLAIRLATEHERNQLQEALFYEQAKLEYKISAYEMFALRSICQ